MTFTHTIAQIEGLENLRAALVEQGASRIMVITGPSRRFVDRLPLTGFDLCIFDGATVHVPREVVEEADLEAIEKHAQSKTDAAPNQL